ncbi:hypothetical protein KSU1_D0772 [Candidatus Jettenia caeni]|uniref:Methyltransferase type 11 domain-containing protein n=2 Tax=Candidatus Jettenia TaxID=360731 RepID=I3IQT6_9BACT|nr:hypothetical protein KSU1_D0772 [Candidatus Jettenia caeni]
MKSLIHRYVNWNWNWNLDSALRYKKAISIIKKIKPITIVEIGSGSRGISAYLKYPSFGIDIAFDRVISTALQRRIKALGTKLPFHNRSIDFVISTDMLEHVNAAMRPSVIKEMFRIVKVSGVIYITVPVGQESENADCRVNKAYKRKHGVAHPMLRDHIKYGLPCAKEIINLVEIEASNLGWSMTVFENTPVSLWEWNLMWFGVERWMLGLRHFQRPILQLLYPFLMRIKSKSNYRIIIIASKMDISND